VRLHPLALLLVPLAIAGCGGGAGPTTKQDLVAKGDAICHDVNAKVNALGRPKSRSEIAGYVAKGEAIERDGLKRFNALKVPAAQRADLTAYENAVTQAIALSARVGALASAGNAAQTQQLLAEAAPLHQQAVAAARRIGFKECSK
jgi:hypothetical protein